MSPRVSPIFHAAGWWIRIPVNYPKDFMDPIPSAADEDSIQLVGGFRGRWLGIPSGGAAGNPQGARGFWYLQRSFFGGEKLHESYNIFCEHFRMLQVGNIYIEYEYGPWILKITRS